MRENTWLCAGGIVIYPYYISIITRGSHGTSPLLKYAAGNKSSTVKRHQGMRVGQQALSPPVHQENNSDESIMSLLRHESVVEFEGLLQTPRCTNHLLAVKINLPKMCVVVELTNPTRVAFRFVSLV